MSAEQQDKTGSLGAALRNPGNFLDSLYNSYLARDFFAKVVPGAIVLMGIVLSIDNLRPAVLSVLDGPWPAALSLYGICWLLGFLVQAIGEKHGWILAYPKGDKDGFQHRLADWRKRDHNLAQNAQRERFVVIKEAMGNAAVALSIAPCIAVLNATVEAVARDTPSWRWIYAPLYLLGLLLLSVRYVHWFHVQHRDRQKNYEERTLGEEGNDGQT